MMAMTAPNTRSALGLPGATADGYYRPEDAQQMQALVHALVHERRHIALSGDDADTLEHYSRLLVRDLRRQPQVKVVGYRAGGNDELLQQINELLADLSVNQVIDRQAARAAAVRVFVVHDSAELSIEELTLMVRLIKDLPGANLRIALIQAQDTLRTASLQALGAQAVHWKMGAPENAPAEARQAFEQKLQAALREEAEPDPGRAWRSARQSTPEPAPVPRGNAHVRAAMVRVRAAMARVHALLKRLAPLGAAWSARQSRGLKVPAFWRAWRRQPAERRNRIVLVAGLATSAALAIGLGLWLSSRTPAPAGALPAAAKKPAASVPK